MEELYLFYGALMLFMATINVIGATIFPHNIGLGSTMNPDLVKKIGEVVAKEVLSTGIPWTFAPTIAVPQNDLWGRTYEGYF